MAQGKIVDLDDPKVQQEMKNKKEISIEKVNKDIKIPISYIPISLSTNGFLGVPEVVHCRNFTVEELLALSMVHESLLPTRIISILNSIIYEEVDVAEWPEKSVIELLVNIFSNFFTGTLTQVAFPWNQEDVAWLIENKQEEKVKLLKEGKWIPRTDINLTSGTKLITLQKEIKDTITITNSKKDFYVKFQSYPHYGDTLKIKQIISDKFLEEEKKFSKLEALLQTYDNFIMNDRDISDLPVIDPNMFEAFQEFNLKKAVYLSKVTMALYIKDFNGEDLSDKTIDEKIEYINDPRFNTSLLKKLEKHYDSLEFGLSPEVTVKNPITGKVSTRRFVFRVSTILQAIQSYESDEYDISYD